MCSQQKLDVKMTVKDLTPPQVVSITPANGATEVTVPANDADPKPQLKSKPAAKKKAAPKRKAKVEPPPRTGTDG
mgnify:CR=1 FL=1